MTDKITCTCIVDDVEVVGRYEADNAQVPKIFLVDGKNHLAANAFVYESSQSF